MTAICPKGHTSQELDYCSECGARIGASPVAGAAASSALATPLGTLLATPLATQPPTPTAPTSPAPWKAGAAVPDSNALTCPECATERPTGARFCEVCRHDFSRPGGNAAMPAPPVAASSVAAPLFAPIAAPAAVSAPDVDAMPPDLPQRLVKLSIAVVFDASLIKEPDPENPFPHGAPERVFPLDMAENLVGRRSESKDSHPEIPVGDPGISRRHLKFLRRADGQFEVVDLNSANGSHFNGQPLEAGVQTLIAAGDEITLGMWTRLQVRAR